ncbi:MAG: type II toxin-antitoxin system HicA family toxin [Chloroflexi bacterium]|nr:type II toxin-antitoxin system HicA family toxin [Chloroflexota bacterium]
MSGWAPIKRREFVRRLQLLGFEGLFQGTRHQFVVYRQQRLTVPSNSEFSVPQLRMMIREIEGILGRKISADEWNEL